MVFLIVIDDTLEYLKMLHFGRGRITFQLENNKNIFFFSNKIRDFYSNINNYFINNYV